MYKKAHEAIRKDPVHKSSAKPAPASHKHYNRAPLSNAQRKDRVRQKQAAFLKKQAEGEAADE